MSVLTQTRAMELLTYDPVTGVLRSKVDRGGRKAGSEISGVNGAGYIQLMIDGTHQYAHRVVWLMVTGELPVQKIDHRNGVKNDNHWLNLRQVSDIGNAENIRKPHRDSQTGFLGIEKHRSGFMARICVAGVRKNLGVFAKKEDAHEAYLKAKHKLHQHCTI